MIKNLICRIKAYAKLTVKGGSSGGEDDFLKKLISSPKDTLIDLGYDDSVIGNRVYAIRRNFTVTMAPSAEYTITLAENVGGMIDVFGTVMVERLNAETSIQNPGLVFQTYRIDDKLVIIHRNDEDEMTYTFNVFSIFVANEKTIETAGNVEVVGKCYYRLLDAYGVTSTLKDNDGNIVIPDDDDRRLVVGEQYTLYVDVMEGCILEGVSINGEEVESIPYTFVCDGDIEVQTYSREENDYV